jgi:hypothetical protein
MSYALWGVSGCGSEGNFALAQIDLVFNKKPPLSQGWAFVFSGMFVVIAKCMRRPMPVNWTNNSSIPSALWILVA